MITISGLAKHFDGDASKVRAIDGIDIFIPDGEFLTLLGPSGCGKTTTLRCLAGLEKADRGAIMIKKRTVVDVAQGIFVPVHERRIGMVFQSYAIWPHMTVMQNVCYPLIERGMNRRERQRRGEEALDLVGLGGLGKRFAPNLSGGQQQRVALARALVAEPEILLLDEPLSNLDAKLRESMRVELRSLQQRLGITTLYVTHDQDEALSMSDIVVVMNNGRVMETGTPRALYERPRTRFVANFLGTANLVDSCPHGCPNPSQAYGVSGAKRSIRPEDISVSVTPPGVAAWEGDVTKALFLGSHTHCEVVAGGRTLKVNVHHSQPVKEDDHVFVWWTKECCDAVTGLQPEDAGTEAEPVSGR